MSNELVELYQTNDDIVFILSTGVKIGWDDIKPQSLNRIVYLSKVLHFFVYDNDSNIMEYYHFTSTNSGPISSIIQRSLTFLESKEFITFSNSGIKLNLNEEQLKNILDDSLETIKKKKQEWLATIMLILGKFGENKIFSFAINDPLFVENIESNSLKEITFDIDENKTLTVLNSFKKAFEESIPDTTSISKKEYLELYFDYVFSQIIK